MKNAEEHTDVDLDDDQRAPYVAKSMTQIAGYLLNGLPEANVKPNARIAAEYLREAAQFFRDEDAQFELAKLYLRGEGIEKDTNYAKHWLSVLSQKGHAGAQAFLADLLWRGKDMPADPVRALALISVAVANAPPYERVWIEDIYQNIFCGTTQGTRKQADGIVATWKKMFARPSPPSDRMGLGLEPGSRGARPFDGSADVLDAQVQHARGERPVEQQPDPVEVEEEQPRGVVQRRRVAFEEGCVEPPGPLEVLRVLPDLHQHDPTSGSIPNG
jgi:hypothetical protein